MPVSFDPPPKNNELECARCGSYFHFELTRCPTCGVNIYEPEDEYEQESWNKAQDSPSWIAKIFSNLSSIVRKITRKPYSAEEVFGDSLDQAFMYDELLKKVGGDHSTAERLIAFERQRRPKDNRKTWIENAIERLARDNRTNKT